MFSSIHFTDLPGLGGMNTKPREVLKSADAITIAILFATVACGYLLLPLT